MQIISDIIRFLILSIISVVIVMIGIIAIVVAYTVTIFILIVGIAMQIYRRVRYGKR